MRLSLPRLPRTIWVLIAGFFIAVITVSIHLGNTGMLYPAALSTKELVSLYAIPIDRQPAQKLEWSFAWRSYVRAVVEQQDGADAPWKKIGSYGVQRPLGHATLIYMLGEEKRIPGRNDYYRKLTLQLGGSSQTWGVVKSEFSTTSTMDLQLPSGEYQTRALHLDPERVFSISSGNRTYRVRLERSSEPFTDR